MSEDAAVVPCQHKWTGKPYEVRTGFTQEIRAVLPTCSLCGQVKDPRQKDYAYAASLLAKLHVGDGDV